MSHVIPAYRQRLSLLWAPQKRANLFIWKALDAFSPPAFLKYVPKHIWTRACNLQFAAYTADSSEITQQGVRGVLLTADLVILHFQRSAADSQASPPLCSSLISSLLLSCLCYSTLLGAVYTWELSVRLFPGMIQIPVWLLSWLQNVLIDKSPHRALWINGCHFPQNKQPKKSCTWKRI